MVMQTEAAECGLACLAMIVGYHGQPCEITELRRRLSVSLKGTSLKHLVGMAERLGFAARPLRLELDELRQLSTPCILHWDLHHFVVLAKVTRDAIVIHDPAVGVRRLPIAAVSRHFTGVALELTPVGELAPARSRRAFACARCWGASSGCGARSDSCLPSPWRSRCSRSSSPLFMQWVVDHALVSADRDLLLVLALGFGMLLLLRTMVSAMRGWIVIVLGASLKVQGRTNIFSHMINLPSSYFEARHLGDVVSRFCSQDTILQAITTDVVEAVLDGLLVSVTLVIMFLFAPTLTFVAIAGALLYGLLRWVSYTPLRHASAEAIVWGARRDSHVLETLRGVKTIKLFNGQDSRRAHWMNLLIEATNRQLTTQKLQLLVRTANALLIGTLAIVVVWLGANLVLEKQMSIGMLLAFIAYKDQFLSRVSNLIDRAVDLTMLRLHAERLADIALTKPEPRGAAADASETARPVAIEVRNLRFRYSETDPWVLDRVSFRIEPGETVAIVGASGCGKTTLLKILASLLPPTEGELLVDGQSLAQSGCDALALDDRRGDAGRPTVRRIGGRQHLLLRRPARQVPHRRVRAAGRVARRDRRHADGLPHADRRHGNRAVGRPEAARADRARAVSPARCAAARRGDERPRRRQRKAGQRGDPRHAGDARHRRAPARDDPLGRSRDQPRRDRRPRLWRTCQRCPAPAAPPSATPDPRRRSDRHERCTAIFEGDRAPSGGRRDTWQHDRRRQSHAGAPGTASSRQRPTRDSCSHRRGRSFARAPAASTSPSR